MDFKAIDVEMVGDLGMEPALRDLAQDEERVFLLRQIRKYIALFHPTESCSRVAICLHDTLASRSGALTEFLDAFNPEQKNPQVETAVKGVDTWEENLHRSVAGRRPRGRNAF